MKRGHTFVDLPISSVSLELRVPVLERGIFAVERGNFALRLTFELANRLLEPIQHL